MSVTRPMAGRKSMTAPSVQADGRAILGGGRLRTIAVMVVTAAVIGVTAWMVDRPSAGSTGVTLTGDVAAAAPRVGEAPPDFGATLVDGTPVRLSQFAGKPVWLTFGASWCGDCRAEAPDVQATYAKYKDAGLVLLAVNIDESAGAVRDYAARAGLTYPAVADSDTAIASRYRILGIPTHFFIDPDGRITVIRLGGLQPEDMEQLVAGIME